MKSILSIAAFICVGAAFSQVYSPNSSTGILTGSAQHYGVAWGDIDGDGDDDLYISIGGGNVANQLYRNNGNGTFTHLSGDPASTDAGNSRSASFGDVDEDGDLDLYVCNTSNDALFINNGSGAFTKVTSGPIATNNTDSRSATWGDYDNDGDLDIFVASFGQNNKVYINNGSGTFTAMSSGSIVSDGGNSTLMSLSDMDKDGDLDCYVVNTNTSVNFLYENVGGTFNRITSHTLLTQSRTTTSCAWGDPDNDLDNDLHVQNLSGQNNELYLNNGGLNFSQASGPIVSTSNPTDAGTWIDIDHDKDQDFYEVNKDGQANTLFTNASATFTNTALSPLTGVSLYTLGAGWNDFDMDGDLDVIMSVWNGSNVFYEASGVNGNWIRIKTSGTTSNKLGIGAKVYLKSGGTWQYREVESLHAYHSQNGYWQHFGLGSDNSIDSCRIEWPSGTICHYSGLSPNGWFTLDENCNVTSIEHISKKAKQNLYAFQRGGELVISGFEGKGSATVQLTDVAGRVALRAETNFINGNGTLRSLGRLSGGIYVVSVTDGIHTASVKFLLHR